MSLFSGFFSVFFNCFVFFLFFCFETFVFCWCSEKVVSKFFLKCFVFEQHIFLLGGSVFCQTIFLEFSNRVFLHVSTAFRFSESFVRFVRLFFSGFW